MASLQGQGDLSDAARQVPYFPPGSAIVAPIDLILPIAARCTPPPRIFTINEQLVKRAQISILIREDEWVEPMIAEPLNKIAFIVLRDRGYQNINFPPEHLQTVAASLVIPHSIQLVNEFRQKLQEDLMNVGFQIYRQFGKKYLIDERCEWRIFKDKWQRELEKVDRTFEESQEKEKSEEKKKKSREKYCEGVIRSYQQLGNFLDTYFLKLLEERVNIEYKKWLASARISSPLEEQKLPRDRLGGESVWVLLPDRWAIGLPQTSPSQKIRKYMDMWPTPDATQNVDHYSITSDWIQTTCQNSGRIFGEPPELKGQEPHSPPGKYSLGQNEEEPYIPTQAPEEDQDVPERFDKDGFSSDFPYRTGKQMLELHSATPNLSEEAFPPPRGKGKWKPSEQKKVDDESGSSTSQQSQDHSASIRTTQSGQAVQKSRSSLLPRCLKGDGDKEKTPPKINRTPRRGEFDEEGDGQISDTELCTASLLEKSSIKCTRPEPHSGLKISQKGDTQQSNTSTSDALPASTPPMGSRPENMNAWQVDVPDGLEGTEQKSIERDSRTPPTAPQRPTPAWATANASDAQVQSMPNAQELHAANGSIAQAHTSTSFGHPFAMNPAVNAPSNSGLHVKVRDPNGNSSQDPSVQAGLKRAASWQSHAGLSRRPPAPQWSQPMAQSNSYQGHHRMPQHEQAQAQGPVSSMIGGRLSREDIDLTHPAYNSEWEKVYKINGMMGGRGTLNRMERMGSTPQPIHGPGRNVSIVTQNFPSSYFAGPGFAPTSNPNSVQPVPNHPMNQFGNPQNGYSNYLPPQMPMVSSPYPSMIPFTAPQPQMVQPNYNVSQPVVRQISVSDSAIQAGFQSGQVQYGMISLNNMIQPNAPPAMPQAMQQMYGSPISPLFHNNGPSAMAQPPTQTPQLMQQPSVPSPYHNNGQPMKAQTLNQASQPVQYGNFSPSPSMMASVHNDQSMNALEPTQTPRPPHLPQHQNIIPQQAGGSNPQMVPAMSTPPANIELKLVRQVQSEFVGVSQDAFPSLPMNQASGQNSSHSRSDGSSGRRSNTSSGERSSDTRNIIQSSTSGTTPPDNTPGTQSQNSPSESDRPSPLSVLLDPQTRKFKRKVGRPSKAQKAAEAELLAKAETKAQRLNEVERNRETAAFEAELAQHLQSLEPYWRNGDDLTFPPERPITQPIQQIWSIHPPPIPQDVGISHLNRLWNVTVGSSQVLAPDEADAQSLRGFLRPETFPVLSSSKLLVQANDGTVDEETLFADVDFDGGEGNGNEKAKGKDACEGARLDGLF